jgi:FkbM family methyltransferase
MKLRCEVVIPSGFRRGRVLVRLRQPEPGVLELLPAGPANEATHQVVNACGMPFLTHLPENDAIVSGELLQAGYWEFAESMLLLSLARPGMTLVDAGANLGYYSVLLAPTLGPSGQVYAFEPEPRNYLAATANALLTQQLFPQAAPTRVFPVALTDRLGTARLNLFGHNLGMHSLVFAGGNAGQPTSSRDVPTVTLDALRESADPSASVGRRIDLLKADVQGSELPLLRGAERVLERDRPVLCLEYEPYLTGADACVALLEWLQGRGYASFRVFHSNVRDPHQALAEAVLLLTAEQVLEKVRRQLVGPYGSLLAFPSPPEEADEPLRAGP